MLLRLVMNNDDGHLWFGGFWRLVLYYARVWRLRLDLAPYPIIKSQNLRRLRRQLVTAGFLDLFLNRRVNLAVRCQDVFTGRGILVEVLGILLFQMVRQ